MFKKFDGKVTGPIYNETNCAIHEHVYNDG